MSLKTTDTSTRVAVVGGGLVGSLWSLFLARRGYRVDVFEGRPDMRGSAPTGGRSINLAMSVRGWTALERAGMREAIEPIAIPMYGRRIHQTDGAVDYQPYGKSGQAIYSVSRGELNRLLIQAADEHDNVTLHFRTKCSHIDLEKNILSLKKVGSGTEMSVQTDLIFGTDGAYSRVRYRMQRTDRFDFSQSYLPHGYKELTIPPGPDGRHRLDKNALHIWPRRSFMLIALPNLDGSFTCTLFAPFEGRDGFDGIETSEDVEHYFGRHFPTAMEHMPDLTTDFFDNPTASLVTMRCAPWHRDQICLLGDASHAIVPFYGQGMNAGFEDCRILDELVDTHALGTWTDVFEAFSRDRKPDADAIADLAIRNFHEMSDSTADEGFLKRKKLERHLMNSMPDDFIPQYSMVSFSNKRYRHALETGDAQTRLLESFLEIYPDESDWDRKEALHYISEGLKKIA